MISATVILLWIQMPTPYPSNLFCTFAGSLLVTIALGGCGGGGGGDAPAATASTTSAAVFTPTPTPTPTPAPVLASCKPASTGGLNVSLCANRVTGVAPLSVFFDASDTVSPTVTSKPFHDIKYTWNFGDSANGAKWTYGTRPNLIQKNIAYGAVAGHVFESPGTYTVMVTAFDGATTSTRAVTVTVTDPNVVFSGSNTICVANGTLPVAGSNGCPTGAAVANVSTVTQLLSAAGVSSGSGAANKRILLKRGDSWNVTAADYIRKSNGTIGAYGTGAAPLIRFTSNNTAFFMLNAIGEWTFMDLDFVGVSGFREKPVATQFSAGSNILMLRLNASLTAGMEPSGDGIFMVDCNLHELVGGNGYVGFYTQFSSRVVALGNRIYDASGIEHNIRFQGATKIVISNNTLYKAANTKHLITVRGRSNQTSGHIETWSGVWAEHIVVSDNDLDAGPTTGPGWITHFGTQNAGADERTRDVIFERNFVHGNVSTHLMTEALQNVTIRNNLFHEEFSGTYTAATILVRARSDVGMPSPSSTYIYNNTIYQKSGAHTHFEAVGIDIEPGRLASNPTGTVLKNNLVYAPTAVSNDYTGGTYSGPILVGSPTGATWTASSNSTDYQIKNISPGFISPPSALANWKPTSGYAIGSGEAVPVWDDFFLNPRSGTYSLGAVTP